MLWNIPFIHAVQPLIDYIWGSHFSFQSVSKWKALVLDIIPTNIVCKNLDRGQKLSNASFSLKCLRDLKHCSEKHFLSFSPNLHCPGASSTGRHKLLLVSARPLPGQCEHGHPGSTKIFLETNYKMKKKIKIVNTAVQVAQKIFSQTILQNQEKY